jgi:hypothetical protein
MKYFSCRITTQSFLDRRAYSVKRSVAVVLMALVSCVLLSCKGSTSFSNDQAGVSSDRSPRGISAGQYEGSGAVGPDESPFGVAYGFRYEGETFMPYIRELGIDLTKVYLYWDQVEPRKGTYDWTVVDKLLDQIDKDSEVLIAVWSSSNWGAKAGSWKGGSLPLNMDDYYTFIFNLVNHCGGKIRYWQNDCEPNAGWWRGTKEEFVASLKVFYRAVKDADPAAQVIVGGYTGVFRRGAPYNQAFFDHVFREGKDYYDIFDLRLYNDMYRIPTRVSWFRNRMKELECTKPIVCTEYGGPLPNEFPQFRQLRAELSGKRTHWSDIYGFEVQDTETTREGLADERARKQRALREAIHRLKANKDKLPPQIQMFLVGCSYELEQKRHRINSRDIVARSVMALAAGVEKLWYWDLVSPGNHLVFGKLRLMDESFTKRFPAFYSYKRMVEILEGIESTRQLDTNKNDIYAFEVRKNTGEVVYIMWEKRDPFHGEDQPKTRFQFALPRSDWAGVKITDVFGKESKGTITNGILPLDIDDTPLFVEQS